MLHAQVYALLYWTMPRDRLMEEEEECAAPTPPLAPGAPSGVELLRAPSSQLGLLAAAADCASLPPPPSGGKPPAGLPRHPAAPPSSGKPSGGTTVIASPFSSHDGASNC